MSNQQQQNQKAAQKAELTVTYEVDGSKITLTPSIVQQYIVGSENGTITLPEFKLFTELCKVRKLNPFLKEAYCIKYGKSPAQIVVGKDAVLKRAVLNPSFDGLESGVIVQNTNTGELIERTGTFYLKDTERLVGGWAKVYRKDWPHPTYCSVAFDEVAQKTRDGYLNTQWATKGGTIDEVDRAKSVLSITNSDICDIFFADEFPKMGK